MFAGQSQQHPDIVKKRGMSDENYVYATVSDMTMGAETHGAPGATTGEIDTIHHEEFASDGQPSWDRFKIN